MLPQLAKPSDKDCVGQLQYSRRADNPHSARHRVNGDQRLTCKYGQASPPSGPGYSHFRSPNTSSDCNRRIVPSTLAGSGRSDHAGCNRSLGGGPRSELPVRFDRAQRRGPRHSRRRHTAHIVCAQPAARRSPVAASRSSAHAIGPLPYGAGFLARHYQSAA
jgi:hypothetical protein